MEGGRGKKKGAGSFLGKGKALRREKNSGLYRQLGANWERRKGGEEAGSGDQGLGTGNWGHLVYEKFFLRGGTQAHSQT